MLLSKYNADGGKAWTGNWVADSSTQGNSVSSTQGYSVSTEADGSVYIAGSTGGVIDGQTSGGGSDAFLSITTAMAQRMDTFLEHLQMMGQLLLAHLLMVLYT